MNNIMAIIETTIACHKAECVFHPNAVERAYQQTVNGMRFIDGKPSNDQLVDLMEEAIRANEIYCPHEGITGMHNAVMGDESA